MKGGVSVQQRDEIKAWAYARNFGVSPAVLICQMAELLGEAERRGIQTVGASQDMSSGKTLDRMGLKEALRAVRRQYANAILVHDVRRLSEDRTVLLRILEILQDNNAVLLCIAEDAYTALRGMGLFQQLYQRSFCTGLGLPWLSKDENTETNKNDSK